MTFNSATPGIALTATYGINFAELKRIVVPVQNYNGIDTEITGLAQTSGLFVGKYSWGRLVEPKRGIGTDFATYNIGLSGIATSPDVIRVNELKSLGYTA